MNSEKNDTSKRKRKRTTSNKEKKVMGSIVEIPALSTTITRNRLTIKAGMFNYGKKSNTITRVLSDEAKARADEDLKKILELAKTPPRGLCKPKYKAVNPLHAVTSDTKITSGWGSTSVFKRQKSCNTSGSQISIKSSSVFDEKSAEEEFLDKCKDVEFPEGPSLKEISDWLCHPLKKKIVTMFGSRDCFMETKLELNKFLKKQKQAVNVQKQTSPTVKSTNNLWLNNVDVNRTYVRRNSENISGDFNPMDGIAFLKLAENKTQNDALISDSEGNLQLTLPLLESHRPYKDAIPNSSFSQTKQQPSFMIQLDYSMFPLLEPNIAEGKEESSRILESLDENEKIYHKRNTFSIHSLVPFHDTKASKKFFSKDDYVSTTSAIDLPSQACSKDKLSKLENVNIPNYANVSAPKSLSNYSFRNMECSCRCMDCIQNKEAQVKTVKTGLNSSDSLDILDFLDNVTTKQRVNNNVSHIISASNAENSPMWKLVSFNSPNPSEKICDTVPSPKFYRHRLY